MTLYVLPSGDAIDPCEIKSICLSLLDQTTIRIITTFGELTVHAATTSGARRVRNRIIRETSAILLQALIYETDLPHGN